MGSWTWDACGESTGDRATRSRASHSMRRCRGKEACSKGRDKKPKVKKCNGRGEALKPQDARHGDETLRGERRGTEDGHDVTVGLLLAMVWAGHGSFSGQERRGGRGKRRS